MLKIDHNNSITIVDPKLNEAYVKAPKKVQKITTKYIYDIIIAI